MHVQGQFTLGLGVCVSSENQTFSFRISPFFLWFGFLFVILPQGPDGQSWQSVSFT